MTLTSEQTQIVTPATANEAAEILREANAKGTPVGLLGNATKRDYGNLAAPVGLKISSSKLNALIAYQPEDLTVTVGAGMEFEHLQEILAQHNQWLPLDPTQLPGATLGGILATNVSGPKRLLYGTARDLLIGCQFVLADGRIGRSGGRVVKNVTGYDLHKLMIGSLGTLGLLTEVTFKVLPKPQHSQWAVASFAQVEEALAAARQAAGSNTSPAALEMFDDSFLFSDAAATAKLLFAAEGLEVAVKDQMRELAAICQKNGATEISEVTELNGLDAWQAMRNVRNSSLANLVLKWNTTLTDLPKTFSSAQNLANQLKLDPIVQARAGTGIIYLYADIKESHYEQAIELIKVARQDVQKVGGSLVIETAPDALKAKLDVFGNVGDSLVAMKALKNKLDPNGTLNPGRFLKGL